MKREGNLIEKIADTENLLLAFYKAAKSKRAKQEVIAYTAHIDSQIAVLQKQIQSGNITCGLYHYFKIHDPKERTICAASFGERVLHHALMNICHPFFEKHLIDTTYATRVGKGTYAALDRAKAGMKNYKWVAKLDVRKYFDTIAHDVLKQKMAALFKDKKLLSVFHRIIDSYFTEESRGIPIGNLTSQYFANYYLSAADHHAKEILKIPLYIRYMDDILIFEKDKLYLQKKVAAFMSYVETKLFLQFKPVIFSNTLNGVVFLGYKLYPHFILLNAAGKKRFKRKYEIYNRLIYEEKWEQTIYQRHILPLISFTQHADTFRLRKKCIFAAEGQQL